MTAGGLRFGAPGGRVLHVVVDMQRLFAEPGEWHTPALAGIIPVVANIVARHPDKTLFTRFITPRSAAEAHGAWRRYYRRWRSMTLECTDSALLELVAPLNDFVPPAVMVDKTTHGAFESDDFLAVLKQRHPDTLVFTGVETDVCVLASVMSAVDRGYRTLVVTDAVASSSAYGHQATLEAVLVRFDQQVELMSAEALLAAWV